MQSNVIKYEEVCYKSTTTHVITLLEFPIKDRKRERRTLCLGNCVAAGYIIGT